MMMRTQVGFMSMPGVGFFGVLLIGVSAGYVAEHAMKSDHALLINMLVDIVGDLVVAIASVVIILWLFSRSKCG